jgi:hypothetical protein
MAAAAVGFPASLSAATATTATQAPPQTRIPLPALVAHVTLVVRVLRVLVRHVAQLV